LYFFSLFSDTNAKGKLPQCKHNTDTYVAGQAIYPDEYPCFQCSCSKAYTSM